MTLPALRPLTQNPFTRVIVGVGAPLFPLVAGNYSEERELFTFAQRTLIKRAFSTAGQITHSLVTHQDDKQSILAQN